MNKTLIISDSQSKILLDLYLGKLKEIDGKIAPLLIEREEYQDLVNQLQGRGATAAVFAPKVNSNLFAGVDASEYDTNWSIPKKMRFILLQENKPLSARQVFDHLLKYEPLLKGKEKTTLVLIAGEFGDNYKKNKRYTRTGERGQYKYGLIEFDKTEEAA